MFKLAIYPLSFMAMFLKMSHFEDKNQSIYSSNPDIFNSNGVKINVLRTWGHALFKLMMCTYFNFQRIANSKFANVSKSENCNFISLKESE
jgi:hypothetical protein